MRHEAIGIVLVFWVLVFVFPAIGSADTRVQLARQRYDFQFLAGQPALTGLEGDFGQALFIGARVRNRGAKPPLEHLTVFVNVRFEDRRQFQARGQVRLEGIESGKKGVVFFPIPLPEEFDPRRLPRLGKVSIQIEANLSAKEKAEKFVEFGAPASPGLALASVDTEEPDAPVVYLNGRESFAGGRRGRLIRPKIPFWTGPGTPAAKPDGEGLHDQPVRQVATTREWRQVRTFLGKTGWVPEMLVSKAAPEAEEAAVVKLRNYGSFRFVDYSVLPSQEGGTVVEGRMLNDTSAYYFLAAFEVILEDPSGRRITSGQMVIRDFARKEVAPFVAVFEDLPSYRVARAKFRLKDVEKRTEVIVIDERGSD